MRKNELIEYSEHEIKWLRYYATRKSRNDLTNVENLYEDLVRMGYSKRQMSLYRRCSAAMVTSDCDINSSTNVDDVHVVHTERNVEDDVLTSLEVFIKLYPSEHENILNMLKDFNVNPTINLKN